MARGTRRISVAPAATGVPSASGLDASGDAGVTGAPVAGTIRARPVAAHPAGPATAPQARVARGSGRADHEDEEGERNDNSANGPPVHDLESRGPRQPTVTPRGRG